MDGDTTRKGEPVALSVLSAEDQALAAEIVARFRDLSLDAGYELDPLRMAFAGMGLAALIRTDIGPDSVLKTIRSIREVASLMGVETGAVSKKTVTEETGALIDAINPRLEGLLEAIERGHGATGDEHSGARGPLTAYQEM